MVNHPNRSRGPYIAEIGGSMISRGVVVQCATIREARQWAESYGDLADWCTIKNKRGDVVARHCRDRSGQRWNRVNA